MKVAVVGAGVGGLAAGIRLAALGHRVTVFDAAPAAGGKCGRVERDGFTWDSGPSLLTMPWVLEALFADTSAPIAEALELLPVEPVTRYRFADGTGFDLSADAGRSRESLEAWRSGAGAEWDRFMATCAGMWRASEAVLAGPAPWPPRVPPAPGPRPSPLDLARVKPWWTLRRLARAHTADPRLQMVIERFATYAGADPRRAPAALAVAGYVEHAWGAWHPRGGLYALVEALVRRLEALGGELRLGTPVRRIALARETAWRPGGASRAGGLLGARARASGVETDGGQVRADAIVAAIDAEAVHRDLLRRPLDVRERSVSGLALMLGLRGRTPGLVHHSIAFPADYDAEFDDVFVHRRPVRDPTVYVSASCATDPAEAPADAENWFVLVNAPPIGDGADWEAEAERLVDRLGIRDRLLTRAIRTPGDLERETGGVAGAIYGVAPHGRLGTLRKPATVVRGVRGLWLAGGTVHPGGGLPLVLLGAATAAREIGPA
jgi:phytoene desaturase